MTTLNVLILKEPIQTGEKSEWTFSAICMEHFLVGIGASPAEARVALDEVIRCTIVSGREMGYEGLAGIKPAPEDLQLAYKLAPKIPPDSIDLGDDVIVEVHEARAA